MMLCYAVIFKSLLMHLGAVTRVGFPTVMRKLLRKGHHHPIPRDFGDNGRGRNGQTARIPFD